MLVRRMIPRGFTITELMVAIGVIIVLLGILLPALATMRSQGAMADSSNNLRQAGIVMRTYSTDNREYIVPSQFNYQGNPYVGHVRNDAAVQLGAANTGTWTDILWTVYGGHSFKQLIGVFGHDYSKDSPDMSFYSILSDYDDNIFRSAEQNTKTPSGTGAFPFGTGPTDVESSDPGYFAANNFFNADPTSPTFNGWFVTGQIKSAERTVYAVDSSSGEVIEDDEDAWKVTPTVSQVDFRYVDACIMLFLDGSVRPEGVWDNIFQLEDKRQIKIRDLTN